MCQSSLPPGGLPHMGKINSSLDYFATFQIISIQKYNAVLMYGGTQVTNNMLQSLLISAHSSPSEPDLLLAVFKQVPKF